MKRKILSAVLGAVLTFGTLTASVSAEEIRSVSAEQYLAAKLPTLINNTGMNNYTNLYRWARPVSSYLTTADGGYMRVQSDSANSRVLVEYYSKDFTLKSSKTIKYELPIFGAFYETEDSYYILSGQKNPSESDAVEVFRVTKYDKSWKRISAASLYGERTTVPFDAGCARMAHCGSTLVIRTCHEMYTSADGKNHQANVTISVNTDTMTVTEANTEVENYGTGYCGHSFNQFIIYDGENFVGVDHGDAYPRSVVLNKWAANFDYEEYDRQNPTPWLSTPDDPYKRWIVNTDKSDPSGGRTSYTLGDPRQLAEVSMLDISGSTGDNETGVTVGGFEVSDSSYIVAGTTINQNKFGSASTRNVFVSVIGKNCTSDSKPVITKITNYSEGQPSPSNPQLVKIGDDKFVLMWTYKPTSSDKNKVYYTELNGKGETVGKKYSFTGELSDCQPIVSDGKILWYVCDRNKIGFYSISTSDISKNSVSEIYTQKPAKVSDYGIEKLHSKSSIKFNWRAADRAAAYVIKYSTDGKSWKTASADSNTCTIKKLKPGTKYYIKIAAKNSAGTSDYCSVFTITTKKK